ncbi:MAG: hypothetical protein NTW96_16895 [Planctomycetia bacterium]|nr:hypothetical protein [Planctomycetia bacterium]
MGVLLVVVTLGCGKSTGKPGPLAGRDEAIAATEKLRGRVGYDSGSPGRPIIEVSYAFTEVTDADLVHLKGLTSLRKLELASTRVTGAGLGYLEGLSGLQWLNLSDTRVTDPGLEHLTRIIQNCGNL